MLPTAGNQGVRRATRIGKIPERVLRSRLSESMSGKNHTNRLTTKVFARWNSGPRPTALGRSSLGLRPLVAVLWLVPACTGGASGLSPQSPEPEPTAGLSNATEVASAPTARAESALPPSRLQRRPLAGLDDNSKLVDGVLELPQPLFPDAEGSKLRARDEQLLSRVAEWLRLHPEVLMLRIEVFAGGEPRPGVWAHRTQIERAQRRADNIFRYLWRGEDIWAERLDAVGYGFRAVHRDPKISWPVVLRVVLRAPAPRVP